MQNFKFMTRLISDVGRVWCDQIYHKRKEIV